MRKIATRLVSAALAASMLLAVCPVSAFASGGGTTPENGGAEPAVKVQAADGLDQQNDDTDKHVITPEKVAAAIGDDTFNGTYSITEGGTYTVKAGTYSYTMNASSPDIGLIQIETDATVTIKIETGVVVDTTSEKYLIGVSKGTVTVDAAGAVVTTKNNAGFLLTDGEDPINVTINDGVYKCSGETFLRNNGQGAEMTLNRLDDTDGYIENDNGKNLTINSGRYEMKESQRYVIYVVLNRSSMNIYGGTFSNSKDTAIWNSGTLNIEEKNGETIEIRSTAEDSYALYCSNYSVTNLYSGTVQAAAKAIGVDGSASAVNLIGGTAQNSRYGLYMDKWWSSDSNVKVTLKGTQFTGNGADIYLESGSNYNYFKIDDSCGQNLKVKVGDNLWPGDKRPIATAEQEAKKDQITSVDGYDVLYEGSTIYLYCKTLNVKDITWLPELVAGTPAEGEGWSWKKSAYSENYILTIDAGYALNLPEGDAVRTVDSIINKGVIKSGNFITGSLSNDGMITGGTFKADMIWNYGPLNGGTFNTESLNNSESYGGKINGGVYKTNQTGSVEVTGTEININGLGTTAYVLSSAEYPQKITAKYTGDGTVATWKTNYKDEEKEYFASGKVTHATGEMELTDESLKAELKGLESTLTLTPVAGTLYDIKTTKCKATVNGAVVTKAAEGAPVVLVPDGLPGETFVEWMQTESLPDWNEETASFTMPAEAVEVSAVFEGAPEPETGSSGADAGGAVAAAVIAAGAGWAGYELGVHLYQKYSMGIDYWPENRVKLAVAVWEEAGKPAPERDALYADIDANDTDAQKAARWCVEQGLLDAKTQDDGTECFKPAKAVTRLRCCLTWQKAKDKGLFDGQNTAA